MIYNFSVLAPLQWKTHWCFSFIVQFLVEFSVFLSMANQGGSIKSTSINGVKLYNISGQRSLATWLAPKKLKSLRKNKGESIHCCFVLLVFSIYFEWRVGRKFGFWSPIECSCGYSQVSITYSIQWSVLVIFRLANNASQKIKLKLLGSGKTVYFTVPSLEIGGLASEKQLAMWL